jgi:hypothetical protein
VNDKKFYEKVKGDTNVSQGDTWKRHFSVLEKLFFILPELLLKDGKVSQVDKKVSTNADKKCQLIVGF